MRRATLKTRTRSLQYTITSRPRVTRRLHMELDEHGGLVVVAPRHWSIRYIQATMARNIHRVEKFLTKKRGHKLEPLQYQEGENHLYLGKQYPLAIHRVAGRRRYIAIIDGEIRINTPALQGEKTKADLQNWYLHQARAVFAERLGDIVQRAPWARGRDIPLKLRRMKRTWGNCSSCGVIKLNTHLIKAPLRVIDSVIAHELCHLEEMNHGRAFYTLLDVLNPGWRQDRVKLRSEAPIYLLT